MTAGSFEKVNMCISLQKPHHLSTLEFTDIDWSSKTKQLDLDDMAKKMKKTKQKRIKIKKIYILV